ncbi:MAG TPA: hypothetical protein VIJ15_11190 [Dermatophilaceae bacterium]
MSPTRTAPDLLSSLKTGWNDAMQQWWDQSQTAFEPWRQAWETVLPGTVESRGGMPPSHHRAHHLSHHRGWACGCQPDGHETCGHETCEHETCGHESCGHETCGHETCESEAHEHGKRCCATDADVILHARAGENRVVPFRLGNPWHREREVTLAAGPWQLSDGSQLKVSSRFDAGETLTLQPCERRVVRLLICVRAVCDDVRKPKEVPDAKNDQMTLLLGCDVTSCVSAYADVRFEGCARPQRVRVVVHPAGCDAVELPCDCGCC